MIGTGTLVGTAVAGYKWLRVWHGRQANPAHLPVNALLLFQRFKAAYDGKDVGQLSACISDEYRGDAFAVLSKGELLRVLGGVFRALPWMVYPCLSINVYNVIADTPEVFSAIIDTCSRAKVLGVPVGTIDSAPLRCVIRPVGPHCVWRMTEMFIQWELVG